MRKIILASIIVATPLLGVESALAAVSATPTSAASVSSDRSILTPEQRARLAERLRLIDQIARTVEPDLRASGMPVERRQWMLEALYTMPLEKLQSLGSPTSFRALSEAIVRVADTRAVRQKALGSTTLDLVYKPVAPCRFADTRIVGGKVAGTRSFDISQNGSTYGGDAGCNVATLAGVPDDAIGAVAMNITFFDTSTAGVPGFLGVRPVGSTNLTSALNWNSASPTGQDANTTVVAMDQSAATDEFEIFDSGPVHVIIDIMGVFTAPGATALDCTTVNTQGAGTVATGQTFPFPVPTICATGYTGVAIGCEYGPTPPQGLTLTSVGVADVTTGFLTCVWRNDTGGPLNGTDFRTHTRCCRVPGR